MPSRILLVEDDPDIGRLVVTGLEEIGLDVDKVSRISEFESAIGQKTYDLCMVDLGLPDGNGLQLVEDLRRRDGCGIIILSGRSAEIDRIIGLEVGADDYITKPFRMREMVARVRSVLRRVNETKRARSQAGGAPPETGEQVEIAFDGYRLLPASRRLVAPDDSEIHLTTAEFNLFSALVQRRGRVLSRDELMNAVKGRDWESYDRAIDGLVSRLRRKVPSPEGREPYIRTVHGIGYTFSG